MISMEIDKGKLRRKNLINNKNMVYITKIQQFDKQRYIIMVKKKISEFIS